MLLRCQRRHLIVQHSWEWVALRQATISSCQLQRDSKYTPNSFDFLQFIMTTHTQPITTTGKQIHLHRRLRDYRIRKIPQPYSIQTHLNDSVLENLRFTFKENGVPFIGLASNCRAMFLVFDRQFAFYNMACELSSQVREFSKLVARRID